MNAAPEAETQDALSHRAAQVVRAVADPELPYLSLGDLGVVGPVTSNPDGTVHVVLTPTYLGCPATEVIARDVGDALRAAGWRAASIELSFTPPWTPDRITPQGRAKLAAEGIAPPSGGGGGGGARGTAGPVLVPLTESGPVECPQCGAPRTRLLSAFGATPCQELRRCESCGEPFPAIKSARVEAGR